MRNWSWAKVEERLKRRIAKGERKLTMLRNYSKSAYGVELGVKPSTPCVLVEDRANRRKVRRAVVGKKPFKGAVLLHKCDNPTCVASDHLHWGTQSDNLRDCYLKRRHPAKQSDKTVEEQILELEAKVFIWKLQLDTQSLL